MPIILSEDSAKVTRKEIPIPKKAKEAFKAMMNLYGKYADKASGGRVLKRMASDRKYDSKDSDDNGKDKAEDKVSVNNAKVILHRQEKFSPNTVQYQLYGGNLLRNILRQGIRQARGVSKVDAVEPPKPTAVPKPTVNVDKTVTIEKPNSTISLNESFEYFLEDYYEEYDEAYVLEQFLNRKTDVQQWGPLINPSMYKKALSEYVRFGKLMSFPQNKVFQWLGIIMKNTCILNANTNICGHGTYIQTDGIVDVLNNHFNGKMTFESLRGSIIRVYVSKNAEEKLLKKYKYSPKYPKGQQDLFMNDEEISEHIKQDRLNALEQIANELNHELIKDREDVFGDVCFDGEMQYGVDENGLYYDISVYDYLESLGMYEWMKLPDGSDALSDYGIEPIMNILNKFDEDTDANEALVLVNKALDVWHHRGDLASAFIEGGSKSLSSISESLERGIKKIHINETQVARLVEEYKRMIHGRNREEK